MAALTYGRVLFLCMFRDPVFNCPLPFSSGFQQQVSRPTPPDQHEAPVQITGADVGLEEILALDGLGTISVTPRKDRVVTVPPQNAEPASDPSGTIGAKEAPVPSQSDSAHPASRKDPVRPDKTLSPSEQLKAMLAQHDRRAVKEAREVADTAKGRDDGATTDEQPAIQRLAEPKAVHYTPAQPQYEHVKLSAIENNGSTSISSGHSAQGTSSDNTTSAPDVSDQASSNRPLRHLPQNVQNRLNTFVEDQGKPTPPPQIPPLQNNGSGGMPHQTQTASAAAPRPVLPNFSNGNELKDALYASRRAFFAAGLFSMVINLLMLTGPLFMLQVYDRVMASGSIPTLLVLFTMTALLYAVMGLLELARSRIVVRIGVDVDQRIGERVFQAALQHSLASPSSSKHTLRELDHLRSFLAGPGPLTFFDAPWTPIYLIIIFALHWTLGLAATIGGIILVGLALLSEVRSRAPLREASASAGISLNLAETGQRNAETITAMGMLDAYRERWQNANRQSLSWQVLVADRLGSTSALSKSLRLLMQSTMLAIGAALALQNQISAGTIVAASIIFGRALAPVEQAIAQWRPFSRAREAYNLLSELLRKTPPPKQVTALPTPKGYLAVDNLRVAAMETRTLILSNLNFAVEPGQMLAVVGPSASGKSTLAKTLVGLWPPLGGTVRIDGARLDQWNQQDLGKHIGYLPQSVELFSGTVKDNISRFDDTATDESVIYAARMAHAHEVIVALPQGYDTPLGIGGAYLSGGQRQRIGLARALYGDPALIVLDEPNANLDRHGDEALDGAIEGMRKRGQTIVLVSHRVGALSRADLLLYLDRGIQRAFGPRDDVLKLLQGGAAASSNTGNKPAAATSRKTKHTNSRSTRPGSPAEQAR